MINYVGHLVNVVTRITVLSPSSFFDIRQPNRKTKSTKTRTTVVSNSITPSSIELLPLERCFLIFVRLFPLRLYKKNLLKLRSVHGKDPFPRSNGFVISFDNNLTRCLREQKPRPVPTNNYHGPFINVSVRPGLSVMVTR